MTAQIPDKIIYKGEKYPLHTNPMEDYFAKYPDKRPYSTVQSSALWRGYVATFEIIDNQLYLKDIEIEIGTNDEQENYRSSRKSVINEVFPNQETVKVDWMTGSLVLPSGKMVEYVHMGYASTYEHYILLEIENGDLKSEKQLGYEEYNNIRDQKFQDFKKTDEYQHMKARLQKLKDNDNELREGKLRGIDDNFIESYLRQLSRIE